MTTYKMVFRDRSGKKPSLRGEAAEENKYVVLNQVKSQNLIQSQYILASSKLDNENLHYRTSTVLIAVPKHVL